MTMNQDLAETNSEKSTQSNQGGVESLLMRLRDEGVAAAKIEAAAIIEEAQAEAERIVESANKKANDLVTYVDQQCKVKKDSAMEALHIASRDTVLSLKNHMTKSLENYVKNLVTQSSFDSKVLKQLILNLAADASKQIDPKSHMDILFPESLLSKTDVMQLSSDMLREGVCLYPSSDLHAGIYIKLEQQNLALDLSDEAITELFLQFIAPRFHSMIVGEG